MTNRRIGIIVSMVLVVAQAATAQLIATRIATIQDDPNAFVGQTVRIRGEVTQRRAIPLTDYEIQAFYDGSGTLLVLSDVSRNVADRARPRVRVIGVATDDASAAAPDFVAGIADFLVERNVVRRDRADRAAERLAVGVQTVLTLFDATWFAIERVEMSESADG